MKAKERKEARRLRAIGRSIREIAEQINCAKSSVSEWVRDIPLTEKQIERLELKQDRARAKAANHPNSPKNVWANIRNTITASAYKEIPSHCPLYTLKILGSALYWAEGYKQSINMVNFSNSDPAMILLMMRFFRNACKVPEDKFRALVHIHPHLNSRKAEMFWSDISGIPLKQFHKTQFGISKASKNKRDTLPLGTFRIVICDTRLKAKIDGWIKGMQKWDSIGAVGAIG
ncbi:MAG: helix-turn-helix domain-containing protein [Candidatus Omnitrophica bacterium]|nr:helix-turn-helix domain-containing protein [Candidatus Omnitrophota bacterium]